MITSHQQKNGLIPRQSYVTTLAACKPINSLENTKPIKNKKFKTYKNSDDPLQHNHPTTRHQNSSIPATNPSNPKNKSRQYKGKKRVTNPSLKHQLTLKPTKAISFKPTNNTSITTQDSDTDLLSLIPFPKRAHRKATPRSKQRAKAASTQPLFTSHCTIRRPATNPELILHQTSSLSTE